MQIALFLFCLLMSLHAAAQTQLNLRTQSQAVDFSAASSTKPFRTGASLPASCGFGELFFLSSAQAGSNLYGCVSANTWSLEGSTSLPPQGGHQNSMLSTDGGSASWIPLGGDVSGAPGAVTVSKIQGRPVASGAPLTGQALVWSGTEWYPQTVGASNGAVSMLTGGAAVGSRSVLNLLSGPGMIINGSDNGSQIDLEFSADTAHLQTKQSAQTGAPLLCISASASTSTYSCALTPTLNAYATNMMLRWKPDMTSGTGGKTLDVDGLGAKPVKLADGTTDPAPYDIRAGSLYEVWYDGTNFRLLSPRSATGVASLAQPACNADYRGQLWHVPGDAGVKDGLSVCAKDETDAYAWRTLY